jgi:hypothetical protein
MIRVPPRHTSWAVATRKEMVPLITPYYRPDEVVTDQVGG